MVANRGFTDFKQAYQLVSIRARNSARRYDLATALKNTGAAQIMADMLIRIYRRVLQMLYYITIVIFLF